MEKSDRNIYGEIRAITRQRLHEVWKRAQGGEKLSPEDERLARLLREHKEYYQIWEMADDFGDVEFPPNGVNPFLHVQLHLALENQLAQREPYEIYEFFEKKIKLGRPRHELCHQILGVLTEMIFNVLKYQKPFDVAEYVKRVQRLP